MSEPRRQLLGIAALNATSLLAQIGQYGIAFVLFPLALQARGAAAWQIGVVSSALWLGMLAGLLMAPSVVARRGHLATLLCGLAASVLALALTPWFPLPGWLATAFVTGLGLGLRWIGLETWMYAVAPVHARGRIVGLHEALLGIAAVLGPVVVAWFGALAATPFLVAALSVALAVVPLVGTRAIRLVRAPVAPPARASAQRLVAELRRYRSAGVLIAGLGGMIEAAWLALFPVYAAAHGLDAERVAWLLTLFGIGAMAWQFPIGWLADATGLRGVALGVAVLTLVSALLSAPLIPHAVPFALLTFLLGGLMSSFLTLGIMAATLAEHPGELDAEVSRVSIAYTALAAVGPVVAGGLVTAGGPSMLMIVVGVFAVVLGVSLKWFR
jgi:MFS family permease